VPLSDCTSNAIVALRERRATGGTTRGVGGGGGVGMLERASGRRRSSGSALGRERGSGRAALRLAAGGCLSGYRCVAGSQG
jgi:hypothetical protein